MVNLIKAQKVILLILFMAFVLADKGEALAWTLPAQVPPLGNTQGPLNIGPLGQSKIGSLILNTSNSLYGLIIASGRFGIGTTTPRTLFEVVNPSGNQSFFAITSAGFVGIGTSSPVTLLSVYGSIKIGNDSSTCSVAKAGTLRWNGVLQVCDGSVWDGI